MCFWDRQRAKLGHISGNQSCYYGLGAWEEVLQFFSGGLFLHEFSLLLPNFRKRTL